MEKALIMMTLPHGLCTAIVIMSWGIAWRCVAISEPVRRLPRVQSHLWALGLGLGGIGAGLSLCRALWPSSQELLPRVLWVLVAYALFAGYWIASRASRWPAQKVAHSGLATDQVVRPKFKPIPGLYEFLYQHREGDVDLHAVDIESVGVHGFDTFFFGLCHMTKKKRAFRVDRIVGRLKHQQNGNTYSTWELIATTKTRAAVRFDEGDFVDSFGP